MRSDLRTRLRVGQDTSADEIARRIPLPPGNGGFYVADRQVLPLIAEAAGESDLANQIAKGLAQMYRQPLAIRADDEPHRATFERRRERLARQCERLRDPDERRRQIIKQGIGDQAKIASEMLAPLLEQMLLDGNRAAAATLIADHLGRIDPQLAARAARPGRLERLEILVRALSQRDGGLGQHRYPSGELWKRASDAADHHLKFLASPRGRGDDAQQYFRHLSGFIGLRTFQNSTIYDGPAAGPMDDQVREALTARTTMTSHFSMSVPSDGESIHIPTRPGALAPVLAQLAERGLNPELRVLTCRRHAQLGHQALYLSVRVEGRLEGRPLAITFTGDLAGLTRAETDSGRMAAAQKAAPEIWSRLAGSGRSVSTQEWNGALREGFVPEEGASLQVLPAQWAASNPCAHRRTSWRINLTGDSTVLHCMECGTQGLASVPQHRIPSGHPAAGISDEQEYLRCERMYAVLRGEDPDDVPGTVGELVARDGVVRMAPELWLGDQTPLDRRARPLGDGIDVAGVGSRRRR